MPLEKAKIRNLSKPGNESVTVLFNPTEYGVKRGANYAEVAIPGLSQPIVQFVRGESSTLTFKLLIDQTDARESVMQKVLQLRALASIDEELHAPPVIEFAWGEDQSSFQGVITTLDEKFTIFDQTGRPLRCTIDLTIKSYASVETQTRQNRTSSPDRTRVRTLKPGQSLAHLALEAYADGSMWRVIAEANDIDRPRFVAAGTPILVPAV
jgi:hypothetical protein